MSGAFQDGSWSPRSGLGAAAEEPLYLDRHAARGAVQILSEPDPWGGPSPDETVVDMMGPIGPVPDFGDDAPPRSHRSSPGNGDGRGKSGAGLKIAAIAVGAAVVVAGGAAAAMAMTGGDDKTTVAPQKDAAQAQPSVNPYVEQQQRRKLAYERASRQAREAPGAKPSLMPKGEPIPTKKPETEPAAPPSAGNPVPAGEAQRIAKAMLPDFGMSPSTQFGCLVKLWNKESGWRTTAANPSGAYGIPQALPGSKMASAGADWKTSARTQIKWGLGYIKDRYGTPCEAWSHSQSVGWY